jgi:integrase
MPAAKKEPRVYQRPGRASYYCDVPGQRYIALNTDDIAEAQTKAWQHYKLAMVGGGSVSRKAVKETLSALSKSSLTTCKTNDTPNTYDRYKTRVERILPSLVALGITTLDDLNPRKIEEWKALRRQYLSERADRLRAVGKRAGHPHATINRDLNALVKVAKEANRGDARDKALGALREAMMREAKVAAPQGLTRDQQTTFVAAMAGSPYYNLCRMLLGAGLRMDEALHIDAGDVRDNHISIAPKYNWATKSYRERQVRCSPTTIEAARQWITQRDGGQLALDPKTIWKAIKRGCVAAKVKPFGAHYLRKLFATNLSSAGAPLKYISGQLGHADLLTTQRYILATPDDAIDVSRLAF